MSTQADSKPAGVRQSVFDAMNDWHQNRRTVAGQAQPGFAPAESVLQSIPRREQFIDPDERRQWLPYLEPLTIKSPFWISVRRIFTWLVLVTTIMFGNWLDQVLRRSTDQRRAVRLRKGLERAGGTFVKLGQQLAMRIDLLPWAYCVELSKMLDRMVPFPTEKALKAVERTIKRPWQEVFAVFDPNPIGSASLACVYQAILKDGTKVVVKVRRPGIAELFKADLQVLDWVSQLAEFLTFIRPGFTKNLRTELREILLEEIDFRREARFQDIFRRNSKKSGQTFFTAPRVYFELSGSEVLVQEFVSGLWLWEIISIVEHKDPEGLALLSRLNIDPALVARRILWINFWSGDEHVFFHADPHPANILIGRNSAVTFIDFGSCGSFNGQQLVALEEMVLAMQNQDVEAMTRAGISLMEPLPPVDLPALIKHSQNEYLRVLHTFDTPAEYTQYWERTSARQWLVIMRSAQKFNLSMNLHMLRMIRAILLYDSIVLRLDAQLDRYYEYILYMKDRAKLIKLKWRQRLHENAGDNVFLQIEELGKSYNNLMIRAQTTLGKPLVNLGSTVDKWIFAASVLSRLTGRIMLVTVLGMGLVSVSRYLAGQPASPIIALGVVAQHPLFQAFLVVAGVFNVRHILFRLLDRDASRNR